MVTGNLGEFGRVEGLRSEDWMAEAGMSGVGSCCVRCLAAASAWPSGHGAGRDNAHLVAGVSPKPLLPAWAGLLLVLMLLAWQREGL